jgi:hypothetical protein
MLVVEGDWARAEPANIAAETAKKSGRSSWICMILTGRIVVVSANISTSRSTIYAPSGFRRLGAALVLSARGMYLNSLWSEPGNRFARNPDGDV